MAGWNRRRVGAGWCVAGLLIVLVAGCGESPGLARRKTTRGPVPPREGDPSARIAALIGELAQIEAGDYGMIGGKDPNNDPIVVDLIAEGEPAVEPLLVALATDERLTKTTICDHGKNQGLLPFSGLPAKKEVTPQLPREAPKPPLVGGLGDDTRAGADEEPVLSWDQRSKMIGGHNVLSLQAPAGMTLQSVTWEIEGTIASQERDENGFVNTPLPNPLIDRPGPGTTEAVVSFGWDGRAGTHWVTTHAETPTAPDDPPDGAGDRALAPVAGKAVRIEGVVRERGTGEPVAGARVRDTKAVGAKSLAVRTDKAGRYAFNSPPGKAGAEVIDLPRRRGTATRRPSNHRGPGPARPTV